LLHVCLPGRGQPGPIHVHVLFILALSATGAIGRTARTLRGRSSHAHIPVRLEASPSGYWRIRPSMMHWPRRPSAGFAGCRRHRGP